MSEGERYAGGVFLFAAGCVAGWLWAIKPGLLAGIDWVQVMIAFGTVGATGAAVGIAGYAEARRREDKAWQAASLKWATCRWVGSVKTGADLLAKYLESLAGTEAGQPFSSTDMYMVKMARKMIDPGFMLPLMDRLHLLEEDDGRTSNAVTYAWAICGHIDNILPTMGVAHEEMEILSTCAKQSKELHDLAVNIISAY